VQSICSGSAHRDTHVLRKADAAQVAVVRDGFADSWNTGDQLTLRGEQGTQLWRSGSAPKLLVKGTLSGERGLLFSPDGAAAGPPFRIVRVPGGREMRLPGARPAESGGWSEDGRLFATWTVVDHGAYYD